MHSERLHPKDYTFWDMQLRKDAKQRQKKGAKLSTSKTPHSSQK